MRFRRSSPFTPDRVRPTKTTHLRIEVLEDRLPPGDLGFVGALLFTDIGNEEQAGEVRDLPAATNLVTTESGSRSSSQIDLLNTVSALPTEYGPAVSAPTPVVESQYLVQDEGVSQLDALAGAINLDETLGGRGPGLLVAPNTRVNSRDTCPGGVNGRTQSEVSITFEPNSGAMVVGYNDSRGFGCPTQAPGYQVTGWGYSLDYGGTFTDGGPLPGGQNWRGDPWLATGPDGTIYFATLWGGLGNLGVSRGTVTGGGINWTTPTLMNTADGQFDKEAMAVDPVTGNVVVTYTRFGGPGGIWSLLSTNGGQSFNRAVQVTPGTPQRQGSFPVFGPSGEIYVAYNIGYPSNTGVGYALSWDGGLSYYDFGQVASVQNFTIPGFNRGTHPNFPQLAIDSSYGPNHGNVYIVYSTVNGPTGGDIMLIRSTDYGLSWSAPLKVNDDTTTGIQFYPTITTDSTGNVNVAFYDRRLNPGTAMTDVYFAQSQDGGLSFGSNIRVTEVTSLWNCCNDMSPNYGDYIHSYSAWGYTAITWADSRDGDPDAYMSWVYPAA